MDHLDIQVTGEEVISKFTKLPSLQQISTWWNMCVSLSIYYPIALLGILSYRYQDIS